MYLFSFSKVQHIYNITVSHWLSSSCCYYLLYYGVYLCGNHPPTVLIKLFHSILIYICLNWGIFHSSYSSLYSRLLLMHPVLLLLLVAQSETYSFTPADITTDLYLYWVDCLCWRRSKLNVFADLMIIEDWLIDWMIWMLDWRWK